MRGRWRCQPEGGVALERPPRDTRVSPELAAGLRAIAEVLPAGTAIPVPREILLELLGALSAAASAISPADPTVEEVASRYSRAPSTVRGWCEAGRFPGAYKLHNREWRIPSAALAAFEAAVRGRATASRRDAQSLGDWRHASEIPSACGAVGNGQFGGA